MKDQNQGFVNRDRGEDQQGGDAHADDQRAGSGHIVIETIGLGREEGVAAALGPAHRIMVNVGAEQGSQDYGGDDAVTPVRLQVSALLRGAARPW